VGETIHDESDVTLWMIDYGVSPASWGGGGVGAVVLTC
jgi:hypothetical protein